MYHILFFLFSLSFISLSFAKDINQYVVQPKHIPWQKDVSGVKTAILHAYNKKNNTPYFRLFNAPSGFTNYPHIHKTATFLYVVKGALHLGFKAKFDKQDVVTIKAGGYVEIPKNQTHYEWFDSNTVMVSSGIGDRATFYVKPNGQIDKKQGNYLRK